jgi:hypothetical protein
LSLETPEDLKLIGRENEFKIKALSTRESSLWSIPLLVKGLQGGNCQLRISIPPNESCTTLPDNQDLVIYSRPFGLALLDLFLPDTSLTHSPIAFQHAFFTLEHSLTVKLSSITDPASVLAGLPQASLCALSDSRFGLSLVTWLGDRLMIMLTLPGESILRASNQMRVEMRSESRELVGNIKRAPEEFIRGVINNKAC